MAYLILLPRPAAARPGEETPGAVRLDFTAWRQLDAYFVGRRPGHFNSIAWTGREPGMWRLGLRARFG
ncbi:hypothetical protein QH494_06245 [Sphingomonas sp. AR_OL41]|uniref:hypothetical protein n=1 Tax=Sphingomonas sp. AR_OL41 TaxID=3042729 RepID=UPI0024803BC9|nr:hypothetical protein [Sphingomonas sp. AR_OL41]MDH7971779.1 hypothetical protein [Sphingomonas sp. AR_OL41]